MTTALQTPLQIVVPCYNEARRFSTASFATHLAAHPELGVILVDDGSTDQTLALHRELQRQLPGQVELMGWSRNRGKGEAVREGMRSAIAAGALYCGYWDADLATPLSELPRFEAVLRRQPSVELVLGARVSLLGRDIRRKPQRHYVGRVFATAASLVLGLPVYDTQCGAKLLRITANTTAVLASPFCSRWIFDVELIARLLQEGVAPSALCELPLHTWHDIGQSQVRAADYVRAARELMIISRRYPGLRTLRSRSSQAS